MVKNNNPCFKAKKENIIYNPKDNESLHEVNIHRVRLLLKFLFINVLFLSNIIFHIEVRADDENNSDKVTISGYVKDAENGEVLVGATVYIKELKTGTGTNQYGYYSFSLPKATYSLSYSYVGYVIINKKVTLNTNTNLNVELKTDEKQLAEVVVTAERPDQNIKQPEMSVNKLDIKTIRQMPALMGEVDVIKAIQMLPGVTPTSEGTSGFSVRGGGADQNLILLDVAPLYNASHLIGFLSVFNNDAISDVKLFKGDIPADYGGRLSSVLDVRMKEGNNKKYCVTGGIGLIDSRLTIEGPIVNDNTSFLISGRRTYADLFFPLLPDTSVKKAKLYFYDFNCKINHQIDDNNRIFVSAYLGRDDFGEKGVADFNYGNTTATIRWNHLFSPKLFMNLTALVSKYDYSLNFQASNLNFNWISSIQDYNVKLDFNYYVNPKNELRFGVTSTLHNLVPAKASESNPDTTLSVPYPNNNELEHAVYISNQQSINEKLTIKYGIRYSLFQNIGPGTIFSFNSGGSVTDTTNYSRGKIFNSYQNIEPRLGLEYIINQVSSFKASYSRTVQYLQLASNSNGSVPLDIWFPADPNVKPQKADQVSIGYFRNFHDNMIETSVETFYKKMYNVIDFIDNADLTLNQFMESQILTGQGHSYGIEFLIRKNQGRFNGWISYTYSRSIRQIPGINNGNPYPSPYDKPNVLNAVLTYQISKRTSFSTDFVYATGAPFTAPNGSVTFGNDVVETYGSRNSARMRDYDRLDVALTVKNKDRPGRKWHGEWVFSVYNAYGRHNDWIINFIPDKNNNNVISAERYYLPFVFFPSVTYNFNF
jgi:outer membrane cobalamin receptor